LNLAPIGREILREFVEGYWTICYSRHGPSLRYRRKFCREVSNEIATKKPQN